MFAHGQTHLGTLPNSRLATDAASDPVTDPVAAIHFGNSLIVDDDTKEPTTTPSRAVALLTLSQAATFVAVTVTLVVFCREW